jgi:anti-anti-sigma regulatory factor
VHEVQFYGDDGELAASVASFLSEPLAAGCPAVVVATPAHRAAFGARLGAAAGRLVMVDAAAMLQGFLAGDRLDPGRFRDAALGLLGRVARPGQPVRIYAEMVALLWDAGQVTLALELETLWNGLAADLPFSLLCGYPARLLAQHGDQEALEQVCALHSGVIGPHPPGAAAEEAAVPGGPADARVVALPDLLNYDSADQVVAALTAGLARGLVVIADLAATSYCTLEGLAALLRAHTTVTAAGAQLRLAGAGPAVRQLLERTGTGQVLAAYATVTAARDGLPGAPG